jgi:hypothetical protein
MTKAVGSVGILIKNNLQHSSLSVSCKLMYYRTACKDVTPLIIKYPG